METISTVGRICSEVSSLDGPLILLNMLGLYRFLEADFLVSDRVLYFYAQLWALLHR